MINQDFWKDKRVFLTGHTGFKGAWLSLWLLSLGAKVYGYSDSIHNDHFLYKSLDFDCNEINSEIGDICDLAILQESLRNAKPDIVIHMAAQSLVRESYLHPTESFNTNIMGTCNVLEATRHIDSVRACLIVTTDKCYENLEQGKAFAENDRLGGSDPYSASKACAEIVTNSYRESFFQSADSTSIATARAGNVIGGGDMSKDRIIPDIIRAYQKNKTLLIRNPHAVRPWQHVLDCLCGYLILTEKLFNDTENYASAWNFGPDDNNIQTVEALLDNFSKHWPKMDYVVQPVSEMKESVLLTLDASKAKDTLSWHPYLDFEDTLSWTASWYQDVIQNGMNARSVSLQQLDTYQSF